MFIPECLVQYILCFDKVVELVDNCMIIFVHCYSVLNNGARTKPACPSVEPDSERPQLFHNISIESSFIKFEVRSQSQSLYNYDIATHMYEIYIQLKYNCTVSYFISSIWINEIF
jgi:hypothetical protein